MEYDELWLAFGTGKHFRNIAVHELANCLGPEKSKALPALTGCDTTSSFCGKGKKTALLPWLNYHDVTAALLKLMTTLDFISDETMQLLERFVILLYDELLNTLASTVQDSIFSYEKDGKLATFLQLVMLFFSMLNMQHINLAMSGVRHKLFNLH